MAQTSSRYRVQSVDRAVDLLEALSRFPEGATLADVCAAVPTSKSAVFATLQTLAARGLVLSVGESAERRYRLGLELARLGELATSATGLRDAALPVLRELSATTGLTSRAVAFSDGAAISVAKVDGPDGPRFDLHLGSREYLHCSSVGKAMLAALDDDAALALLRTAALVARTPHTLTDPQAVLDDVRLTRDRGWAIDDEEDAEGVLCVGAAVLDHRGQPAGALSVTRIKAGVDQERIADLGNQVRDHADRLSGLLGHRVDPVDAVPA